jgi:hypothetical protein
MMMQWPLRALLCAAALLPAASAAAIDEVRHRPHEQQ